MNINSQFSINNVIPSISSRWFIVSILLFAFIIMSENVPAQKLSASLDRSTITLGETVTLSIAVSEPDLPAPVLSALSKDFDILDTGRSSQIQIINGHRTEQYHITITLKPHHSGTYIIPAIQTGKDKTSPLHLTVKNIPVARQANKHTSVWLEIDTPLKKDQRDVMVQQEVPVTVKLFTAIPLSNLSISRPSPENAVTEKLLDNMQYTVTRNGREFRVVEQHYVVFPEQPGDLIIPPVVLQATTPEPQHQRRRSPFDNDMFDDPFFQNAFAGNPQIQQMLRGSSMLFGNPGKPLTIRSDGLKLYVKHIPPEAQGSSWLPARKVTLSSSWKNNPPVLKTGEPATVTLTIKAEGLTSANIPAIILADKKGSYRVYEEPLETEDLTDGEKITGISKQTFTIIPEQTGVLRFPAIKQPWWNTTTHKMHIAEIHEMQLTVTQGSNNTPINNNPDLFSSNHQRSDTSSTDKSSDVVTVSQFESYKQLLADTVQSSGLLTGLIAITIIVLLWFFVLYRRKTSTASETVDGESKASQHLQNISEAQVINDRHQLKALLQEAISACDSGDASLAARSILQWAKLEWPELAPVSLLDIADHIRQGEKNLRQLHQFLYQPLKQKKVWQDAELAKLLRQGLKLKVSSKKSDNKQTLPPLYPA